jgi:hypothetical protein
MALDDGAFILSSGALSFLPLMVANDRNAAKDSPARLFDES